MTQELNAPTKIDTITVIVPSLNPDEKLLTVVNELTQIGFHHIILVDDGSLPENQHYFNEVISKNPQCTLLHHAVNLGKGRALKTAFNYYLNAQNTQSNSVGVITVDGDGQHRTEDILSCAEALMGKPNDLILGCRSFKKGVAAIPKRSSFGNNATAFCFRLLCGINVSDTQTGLRAIPAYFVKELLRLSGERFDYETNMLLETKRCEVKITEVSIQTVYFQGNESSHFHPLRDSLLIYKLIFKFLSSGLASTVLDLVLFILLSFLLSELKPQYRLLLSTIGARLCSSVLNYFLNKNMVFSNNSSGLTVKSTIVKYYLLCAIQTFASYGGTLILTTLLPLWDAVAKIIVDTILFIISFQIQREWIFKSKEKK